jgi:hypothetical protein
MEYNQTWPAAYLTDPEPVRHLLLATVKWDRVSAPPHTVNYEEREDRLSRTVWRGMLDRGARVARFANTQDSAWAVISQLLERQPIDIYTSYTKTCCESGRAVRLKVRSRKRVSPRYIKYVLVLAPCPRSFEALLMLTSLPSGFNSAPNLCAFNFWDTLRTSLNLAFPIFLP